MKVVILAGGKGTRLSEETKVIPKPMVEIGDTPILEHVMEIYEAQGFSDFVIATGYKGSMVAAHFMDGTYQWERRGAGDEHRIFFWNNNRTVEIVFTGLHTQTGGRLKRLAYLLDEPFMMTYGDGLSNVLLRNVLAMFERNQEKGNLVTLTAVHPVGRFGSVETDGDKVTYFGEKVDGSNQWINGGFMVVDPRALDYIEGDEYNWEKDTLPILAVTGQLSAYKHEGFWLAMDSLRDKEELEEIIKEHGKIWLRR